MPVNKAYFRTDLDMEDDLDEIGSDLDVVDNSPGTHPPVPRIYARSVASYSAVDIPVHWLQLRIVSSIPMPFVRL